MLYVVATPIGNLGDISQRALKTLKKVDLVLCEDTRRTGKLLSHFGVETSTESYHQHSKLKKREKIRDLLKEGKSVALVSDAGTPGISDPGGKLIEFLTKGVPELEVVPVPGPSAVVSALSVSGFPADSFLFLGFPPKKRKRSQFFERVAEAEETVVIYESPHRVLKTLREIEEHIGDRKIVVCKEMTKMYESVYRGSVDEVVEKIQNDKVKGEFTIVIRRA